MGYIAVGLAVLGAAAGLAFRWKVLLPIIVVLPVASIIFSSSRDFGYRDTLIVIVAAEAILQGGYFAGLLIRHLAMVSIRAVPPALFKSRRNPEEDGSGERHPASNAGASGVSKGS